MAVSHVELDILKDDCSFKPPYLDKLAVLMQFCGIAHNSKPLKQYKQILLLLYNIVTVCLNGMMMIGNIVESVGLFQKDKSSISSYLQVFNAIFFRGLITCLIIHAIIISRKSLLRSLPKPGHWVTMNNDTERKPPLTKIRVLFYCWILMTIGLVMSSDLHYLFKPDGILSKCANMSEIGHNITLLNNKHLCYYQLVLLLGLLPTVCGTALIPFYLVVWLIYIQDLFHSINDILRQQLNMLGNLDIIQKCKVQYTILCGLIEDFNQNYGIFLIYCVYVTTFMIFAFGYSIITSLVSVSQFQLYTLFHSIFILTGAISLIYHCTSLKSEVSTLTPFRTSILNTDQN